MPSGKGQPSPAPSKRLNVSRTVEAAMPSRRAISRVEIPAENFKRTISRTWRIATLSAGMIAPLDCQRRDPKQASGGARRHSRPRAALFRSGGRHHLVMVGGIIALRLATSSRYNGRLGQESALKTVWDAPTTDARLKKRIVRTLVHEVVADIDEAASEIVLIVHWVGGAHSELRLPKRRRGERNSTSADIIQAVRQLVLIASADLIAGLLNRNGLKTGNGNRWTRERVTSLRSYHHIPVFKPAEDGIEPWLNLSNAAPILKIAPKTLRLAAEAGEIESIHPLSEGPWIFARAALTTFAAQSITERARQNPKYPAGSHPNQQNLFSSIT